MTEEVVYPRLGRPGDPDYPVVEIVPFPEPEPGPDPRPEPVPAPVRASDPDLSRSAATEPASLGGSRSGRTFSSLSRLVPVAIIGALVIAIVATVAALTRDPIDDRLDGGGADVGGATQTTVPPERSSTTDPIATTNPPTSSASPSSIPTGWIVVEAPDGTFRAAVPASPTATSEAVTTFAGPTERSEYSVALDGSRSLVIGVTPASVPPTQAEAYLGEAVVDIAASLGGVASSRPVERIGSATALDFLVAYPGGEMRGRALVVGTTLHLLTLAAGLPDADPADTAAVFEGLVDNYVAIA